VTPRRFPETLVEVQIPSATVEFVVPQINSQLENRLGPLSSLPAS